LSFSQKPENLSISLQLRNRKEGEEKFSLLSGPRLKEKKHQNKKKGGSSL
jgi:hypothetical protein